MLIRPVLHRLSPARAMLPLSLLAAAACATAPAPRPAPAPAEAVPPVAPALPAIPAVTQAPLAIRVVYPADNQVITSRDSNFVLGSVGSGDAQLTINGVPVQVAPNGAFLAWLPNPPASAAQYEIVATRAAERAQRVIPIRYPSSRPALPSTGALRVDTATLSPARGARLRYRSNEPVRVSVRAPANARAWFESNGRRQPMVISADVQASALAAARGNRTPVVQGIVSGDNSAAIFVTDVDAARLTNGARVVISRDADTVRLATATVALADTGDRTVGVLRSTNMVASDTDRVVIGRPTPDGTYKWLLLSGTVVEMTGQQGAFTRVRLDDNLEVWVSSDDVVAMPAGTPLPRRTTGGFRVTPSREWADVVISTGDRPAHYVESNGKSLVLTLYSTQAAPEISPIIGNDTLIRRMTWEQVATDRLQITFTLSQPVFGWLAMWDETRRAFVLRVRRLPELNAARPLAGLVVAVDAGHPPAGSTGPTGLYEGDAVLPVAEQLAALLRERGATPVMTRTTRDALGLVERTVTARRANAHVFMSIHLNALPDGVNPFTNNGTSTLFFHQHSEPLARHVQRAMMERFPLRDLGVHYQNLAIARPTWYPSILAEGLFIMLPEQEAAMKNPEFQRRYAEALVVGLERYMQEITRQ